jgi:hypothetical protein
MIKMFQVLEIKRRKREKTERTRFHINRAKTAATIPPVEMVRALAAPVW